MSFSTLDVCRRSNAKTKDLTSRLAVRSFSALPSSTFVLGLTMHTSDMKNTCVGEGFLLVAHGVGSDVVCGSLTGDASNSVPRVNVSAKIFFSQFTSDLTIPCTWYRAFQIISMVDYSSHAKQLQQFWPIQYVWYICKLNIAITPKRQGLFLRHVTMAVKITTLEARGFVNRKLLFRVSV